MEVKVITDTHIDGSIEFDGEVRFEPEGECGVISVTGGISVKRLIAKAGWSIKAGGSIEAGGSIKAGGYIEAGEYIEAGTFVFSFTFSLQCTALHTKLLPFGRDYYAVMPPLLRWADDIRNKCWAELRSLPTQDEAEEICNWNGWHWIIAAQLRMFFGLVESVTPPENRRARERRLCSGR